MAGDSSVQALKRAYENFLTREKYSDKLRTMMTRLEKRFIVSVDGERSAADCRDRD